MWLATSCPAATRRAATPGFSSSHRPTAKTVMGTSKRRASASKASVRRSSPEPWNVRATADAVRGPATISSAGPPAGDTDGVPRVAAAVLGLAALVALADGADVDVGRAAVVRRRPAAHAPSTTPAAAARNPLRLTLTRSSLRRESRSARKPRQVTLRYLATESGMNTASNPHIHARACQRGLKVAPPTHSARMASTV